jgi:hypothetical protein
MPRKEIKGNANNCDKPRAAGELARTLPRRATDAAERTKGEFIRTCKPQGGKRNANYERSEGNNEGPSSLAFAMRTSRAHIPQSA